MATEVRMPKTPREQAYTAIGILALVLAGYYYYAPYSNKVGELQALEARLSVLQKLNDAARPQLETPIDELRARAEAAADTLLLMRQLVPSSNEVPELLEQVSTAARRAGLDIGPVDVLGVDAGQDFYVHKYRLSITGPYHSVAEFLANVGSLRRIVSPLNVTMRALAPQSSARRAAGPVPTVSTTFEVHTYVARTAAPERGMP